MKTNINNNGNRAVIYTRPLTIGEELLSADAQLSAATEFAKSQGMTIVNTYIDADCPSAPDNRPQFQQMINDSKQQLFDIVIVHKASCFSRDKLDRVYYKRILKQNCIQLLCVTEPVCDTLESLMMESVLEGMAEYFSLKQTREVAGESVL